MWYHFSFASGGNPYIAMSASKKDSLIRKYRNRGAKVERIENESPRFYGRTGERREVSPWRMGENRGERIQGNP